MSGFKPREPFTVSLQREPWKKATVHFKKYIEVWKILKVMFNPDNYAVSLCQVPLKRQIPNKKF
jgi:hypothetical protein